MCIICDQQKTMTAEHADWSALEKMAKTAVGAWAKDANPSTASKKMTASLLLAEVDLENTVKIAHANHYDSNSTMFGFKAGKHIADAIEQRANITYSYDVLKTYVEHYVPGRVLPTALEEHMPDVLIGTSYGVDKKLISPDSDLVRHVLDGAMSTPARYLVRETKPHHIHQVARPVFTVDERVFDALFSLKKSYVGAIKDSDDKNLLVAHESAWAAMKTQHLAYSNLVMSGIKVPRLPKNYSDFDLPGGFGVEESAARYLRFKHEPVDCTCCWDKYLVLPASELGPSTYPARS